MAANEQFVQGEWPGAAKPAAMAFITTHLRIRLMDDSRKPVKGARCRLASDPDTHYAADGDGVVMIPWTDRTKNVLDIQWESVLLPDPFPWSQSFSVDTFTAQDGDCEKRLDHLGFVGGDLAEKVKAYQEFLGMKATGSLADIRSGLIYWHGGGAGPTKAQSPAGSASAAPGPKPSADSSGEVKALVAKLYAAFNDSGVLGLGGTDEEGALAALRAAKEKGLMREVDAHYKKTYPGEETLEEELDDELSGGEFDEALALYQAGMSAPVGAASGAAVGGSPSASGNAGASADDPENPVHATLAPDGNVATFCLLDWGRMPIPYSKCRRADAPGMVFTANEKGMADIRIKAGEESVELEWTQESAGDPVEEDFQFRQTVKVDFAGEDDRALSNQLWNLGFEGGSLSEQLEQYRLCFGHPEEAPARAEINRWMIAQESPVKPLPDIRAEDLDGPDGNSATV